MKRVQFKLLLILAGFIGTAKVCAEINPNELKQMVADEFDAVSQKSYNDIEQFSQQMHLVPEHQPLLAPSYPVDKHEAFRGTEEERALSRIKQNITNSSDKVNGIIEEAIVELFKEQNNLEQRNSQDVALFKQQFSENIAKMAKGGSTTQITYKTSITPQQAIAQAAPAQKAPIARQEPQQSTSQRDENELLKEIRAGIF
jgi:hypothetical protein